VPRARRKREMVPRATAGTSREHSCHHGPPATLRTILNLVDMNIEEAIEFENTLSPLLAERKTSRVLRELKRNRIHK